MTKPFAALALAAAAAFGIGVSTQALPVPKACAAPSPSCGGDLRECLRMSADLRQTTFGGRYVTAEDVSRCMEAFNACIHGGASRAGGQNPATTTSGGGKGLPTHFGIRTSGNGEVSYDCRLNGTALSCTGRLVAPFGSTDSSEETFTGTLSGLSATGTSTGHHTGHAPADPSCRYEQDFTGPATYVFDLNGSVSMRGGPTKIQGSYSCGGATSFTGDPWEIAGRWSELP